MPLADRAQSRLRQVRADRDERDSGLAKPGPELPLIIGQGKVACRTARIAEEDEHRRPLGRQALQRQRRAVGLRQVEGLDDIAGRSEEHTSELPPLMRTSSAAFSLKKKKHT